MHAADTCQLTLCVVAEQHQSSRQQTDKRGLFTKSKVPVASGIDLLVTTNLLEVMKPFLDDFCYLTKVNGPQTSLPTRSGCHAASCLIATQRSCTLRLWSCVAGSMQHQQQLLDSSLSCGATQQHQQLRQQQHCHMQNIQQQQRQQQKCQ